MTPQMAGHKPSQLCSASVWSENSLQSDEHPEIFDVTLLLNVVNYSTNKIVIRTKFFNLSSLCVHQRLAQALGSKWLVKPLSGLEGKIKLLNTSKSSLFLSLLFVCPTE